MELDEGPVGETGVHIARVVGLHRLGLCLLLCVSGERAGTYDPCLNQNHF